MTVYFISGIDASVGKTYATGFIARNMIEQGHSVITQKLVQTGTNKAKDIETHRRIMGIDLLPEDTQGLTCPQIFPYPSDPYFSAKLANKNLDLTAIEIATDELSRRYEVVLAETSGGILTPLTDNLLTADYIEQRHYPLILTTSCKENCINQTLLALEAIKNRGIYLYAIAFNHSNDNFDPVLSAEIANYLKKQLEFKFPNAQWIGIPTVKI